MALAFSHRPIADETQSTLLHLGFSLRYTASTDGLLKDRRTDRQNENVTNSCCSFPMSIFSLLIHTHTHAHAVNTVIDYETDRKQAESYSEMSECFLISCDGWNHTFAAVAWQTHTLVSTKAGNKLRGNTAKCLTKNNKLREVSSKKVMWVGYMKDIYCI